MNNAKSFIFRLYLFFFIYITFPQPQDSKSLHLNLFHNKQFCWLLATNSK